MTEFESGTLQPPSTAGKFVNCGRQADRRASHDESDSSNLQDDQSPSDFEVRQCGRPGSRAHDPGRQRWIIGGTWSIIAPPYCILGRTPATQRRYQAKARAGSGVQLSHRLSRTDPSLRLAAAFGEGNQADP